MRHPSFQRRAGDLPRRQRRDRLDMFHRPSNKAAAMRYVLAAAIVTAIALPAPARAQMGSTAPQKTPLQLQYEREKKEQDDNERDYNAQMKRLKGQGPATTSSDPWKGVRPTADSPAKR
jgi:hypothetical protein